MIERRGFYVVPEEEYYKELMGEFKKEFPNMSDSPSNLLAILARVVARNENMRDYDRTTSYSNAYIATATDQHLSKAVALAGITRILGTRAIGKVEISKDDEVAQIILPASTELVCNDKIYITMNQSTTIINSSSHEIEVISKDVGSEFNVVSGSKMDSVLNIRGFKEAVVTVNVLGGTDMESDVSLRERYFRTMSAYSNSSLKGVMDRVLSIPEVTRVEGNENNTGAVVDGLMPHSFIIYANGGSEQDIANAIMDSKPAGIQTNGDIEKQVVVGGKSHPIRFSRFAENGVYYYFEVAIDREIASPTFIDDIKEATVDFTKKNSSIISYELCAHLSQTLKEIKGIRVMKFGLEPDPQDNSDLVSEDGFVFYSAPENIEVVVI